MLSGRTKDDSFWWRVQEESRFQTYQGHLHYHSINSSSHQSWQSLCKGRHFSGRQGKLFRAFKHQNRKTTKLMEIRAGLQDDPPLKKEVSKSTAAYFTPDTVLVRYLPQSKCRYTQQIKTDTFCISNNFIVTWCAETQKYFQQQGTKSISPLTSADKKRLDGLIRLFTYLNSLYHFHPKTGPSHFTGLTSKIGLIDLKPSKNQVTNTVKFLAKHLK